MRKLILTAIFILLVFSAVFTGGELAMGAGAGYDVRVMVDGGPVVFPDQKPFIDPDTGRTYVPLRFVTEKLGAVVDWSQQDKIAVIQKDDKTIKVPVGSNRPLVNGEPVFLDAPVKLVNGRTVVPLRFMSETLKAEVHWNNNDRTVYIETNHDLAEPADNPNSGGEDSVDDENHDGDNGDNELSHGEEQGEGTGNVDSAVTGWEIEEEGQNVVAVITTSGPVEYNIFTLTGPDRVVLDLEGVKPGELPEEVYVDNGLVDKLRTGVFSEDPFIVRLVFDVKEPVMFDVEEKEKDNGTALKLELYIPDLGALMEGKVIAIDPGHGGHDPGAIGPTGLKEKDVNLDVAFLTSQLLKQNGARVVLTRSTDTYVDLYERTRIAGEAGADVFVSIHMNAHPSASVAGISTFYLRDDVAAGAGVSQEDNRMLAGCVQAQLLQLLQRRDIGVQQANFAVLRTATMPAVLVEASFISNAEEENLLKKDSYRAKIAEAIVRGIAGYFAQKTS